MPTPSFRSSTTTSASRSFRKSEKTSNSNSNSNSSNNNNNNRGNNKTNNRYAQFFSRLLLWNRFRPVIGILFLVGGVSCGLFGVISGVSVSTTNNHSNKKNAPTARHTVHSRHSATTDSFDLPELQRQQEQQQPTMPPHSRKEALAALEDRLRGALWGYFAGDALASPTHWFYGGRRQVLHEYGHLITDYTAPNQKLTGSILNKSDPNGGGRSKGGKQKTAAATTIIGSVINHGKIGLWDPKKSIHYHATLQRGENTLEVSIGRVLLRSIAATTGVFSAGAFRASYVSFMREPGSHNDTYASTCHRMFFANLVFRGLPPEDCPDNDEHNVDTIDGLVLPTIVALAEGARREQRNHGSDGLAPETSTACSECAGVTRRSAVLGTAAGLWGALVEEALASPLDAPGDARFRTALESFARGTIGRSPDPGVRDDSTMSACYLGGSLPGLVDLLAKHGPDANANGGGDEDRGTKAWEALLSNANVGGENVHRGSLLGAVLGARAGSKALPPGLVDGLYHKSELGAEIDAFVSALLLPDSEEHAGGGSIVREA